MKTNKNEQIVIGSPTDIHKIPVHYVVSNFPKNSKFISDSDFLDFVYNVYNKSALCGFKNREFILKNKSLAKHNIDYQLFSNKMNELSHFAIIQCFVYFYKHKKGIKIKINHDKGDNIGLNKSNYKFIVLNNIKKFNNNKHFKKKRDIINNSEWFGDWLVKRK